MTHFLWESNEENVNSSDVAGAYGKEEDPKAFLCISALNYSASTART